MPSGCILLLHFLLLQETLYQIVGRTTTASPDASWGAALPTCPRYVAIQGPLEGPIKRYLGLYKPAWMLLRAPVPPCKEHRSNPAVTDHQCAGDHSQRGPGSSVGAYSSSTASSSPSISPKRRSLPPSVRTPLTSKLPCSPPSRTPRPPSGQRGRGVYTQQRLSDQNTLTLQQQRRNHRRHHQERQHQKVQQPQLALHQHQRLAQWDGGQSFELSPAQQETMIALGFEGPIGAQEEALTLAASGRDLVLSSPTGSGKTLALVLPLLQWHTARSAAAAATRRAERGQASVAMKGSSLHEQFALAASAVSASAVQAISTARVVSVVLAPTATLALQLLGSMRATAAGWIKAAAKIQRKGNPAGLSSRRICLPRLLLLGGETLQTGVSAALQDSTETEMPPCEVDTSGLILFATPETLKRLVTRLAGGPPGSLLHLAGAVRHLVLDEADRMLQPLRRHAPLQERLQSLKKPEALEIFMRLLVTSRKQGGLKGTGSNAASSHHGRSQQQPVLPLQLVAASATVGRPLHRRLTAFVRWKEQQLTRAKDPPLRAGFLGVPHLCPLSGRTRQLDLRKPPLGVFATPQQRMRAALERLAARGLLGIPPIPSTAEGPQALSMLSPSLPPFKALLPIVRSPATRLAERSAKEPQAERNPTGDSRASKGGDEESPRVPRRVGGMPPCITHALFSASDNSAEGLAIAASAVCNSLKHHRTLLLLQQGSSLRSLQIYMREQGLKVDLVQDTAWWKKATGPQQAGRQCGQLLAASMNEARGLHVEEADLVLLLGRVQNPREYQHLAGRVGRCGRPGLAVAISDAATQRVLLGWQRPLGIAFESFSPSLFPQSHGRTISLPPRRSIGGLKITARTVREKAAKNIERRKGVQRLESPCHSQDEEAACKGQTEGDKLIPCPDTLHQALEAPLCGNDTQQEIWMPPHDEKGLDFKALELPSLLLM
ncbi:hypothetical protein cyc_03190 [Cyclospora cayetanensis]|uniref:ATP-dependent RNA helicase n=1 Tax=Cyclospora cayetanensis TaxID=88456 RepID=A0A1D3D9L4_9EIME|nr:hypothetical protein cyc_03190 [Cyclospora cayetanensis]